MNPETINQIPVQTEYSSEQIVRSRSLAKYRQHAEDYDTTCGPTWPIRERAVAALQLQPGQVVLDVGCGTGLSLALLRAAVGETGRIYGFDQSPGYAGSGAAAGRLRRAGTMSSYSSASAQALDAA